MKYQYEITWYRESTKSYIRVDYSGHMGDGCFLMPPIGFRFLSQCEL